MHTVLNRFFELALDATHRYEGTINQFLGDGFMALFGAPIAHEDHAYHGVLAALEFRRLLDAYNASRDHPDGVELTIRMGLNTGIVVVGAIGDNLRMDYTAVGDTTNVAARLQSVARSGQIVLSDATYRLVSDYCTTHDLGTFSLKGKDTPVHAWDLTSVQEGRTRLEVERERGLTPFVGRKGELRMLHNCFAEARAGHGQVVLLTGEAGVGKSRLLAEFQQQLEAQYCVWLHGRCLSYGQGKAYLPIIDFVRHAFQIGEGDDDATRNAKIDQALPALGESFGSAIPHLKNLLSILPGDEALEHMNGQQRQLALFEALWALMIQRQHDQTLILLVEDLHWIDTASEEALRYLADRIVTSPVMLLLTSRPGYQNPFHEKIDITYLALPTLTVHESLRLAENMPNALALPEELRDLLIEKSQGNPFFLEELIRAVIEEGNLQPDMRVPDTIQGLLMARIDRLPEESKRLLQTASVLGREFSLSLLKRLWDETDMLAPLLVELQRQGFLDERLSTVEPLYVFKHALTQEVAYNSLLMSHRQALHLAAGQALEKLYTDRPEEAYERLSYHYANTPEADKAVEYLTLFARKAMHGYALAEAVTALQEALEHVDQLAPESRDHCRLDLVLRQSRALTAWGRLPEALELLLREQACLERLQEPKLSGPYYFRLGHTASLMGDNERAAQGAQLALEAATQCDDTATISRAYYLLSLEGIYNGQCLQGVTYGQQAMKLLEQTDDQRWLGLAHCAVGFNYAGLGEFDHGLEAFSRAYAIGEKLGDVRLQSMALGVNGFIQALRGDWQAGIVAGQRALELSPDPFRIGASMAYLGYAHLEKGDPVEAISLLEQAVEQQQQFRFQQHASWSTTWLGEAYLLNGQLSKARNLVLQALDLAQNVKFGLGVAWAQRALGRIALANGSNTEAARQLQEALETFNATSARAEVARTALDLAEVVHRQGLEAEAARYVEKAYTLFQALQVPAYIERARQLGVSLGIPLAVKQSR